MHFVGSFSYWVDDIKLPSVQGKGVCSFSLMSLGPQALYLPQLVKWWWWKKTFLLLCCSVAKSCPVLCNSMNCSLPGFLVLHYPPESAQTPVHWVGNAIQPSHPLSPPSPPALNLSQHQGLFQWVSSLHQVAKVLELQLSASVLPMNFQGWFPLVSTGLISLQSKELSRVFPSTTIQKH